MRAHYATFELGDRFVGKSEGYVAITAHIKTQYAASQIERVEVAVPWSLPSGHPGGEPFTVGEMRTMRLWVQERAKVRRLLERFRAQGGDIAAVAKAEALIAAGRPLSAYRFLAGEHSLLLPARFAVRGHGPLARLPIAVRLASSTASAIATVTAATAEGIELDFAVREPQRCSLALTSLRPGAAYGLVRGSGNQMRLAAAADGSLTADQEGRLETSVELAPVPIPGDDRFLASDTGRVPGRRLVAMAFGNDIYEVQDADLWICNPLTIRPAPGAETLRWQDGQPPSSAKKAMPTGGDRVEITLDEAGRAVSLRSTYGQAEGVIKSFRPPAVHPAPCNGVVELEDGRSFQFFYHYHWTRFEVAGLKPQNRANAPSDYQKALKPGMRVKLAYSPFTWNGSQPRILTLGDGSTAPKADRR